MPVGCASQHPAGLSEARPVPARLPGALTAGQASSSRHLLPALVLRASAPSFWCVFLESFYLLPLPHSQKEMPRKFHFSCFLGTPVARGPTRDAVVRLASPGPRPRPPCRSRRRSWARVPGCPPLTLGRSGRPPLSLGLLIFLERAWARPSLRTAPSP